MAYITLANSNKIIYKSDFKSLKLTGEVYKIPIHFFSKYEENALLAIQELLRDPEKYFNEIYIPFEAVDTYKYVYEGHQPRYHKYEDCPRLKADYQNFEIPFEIREKGIEAVEEFRQWFETVKHLLEKPDIFVERLRIRWGIETNPKAINRVNSGSTEKNEFTIEELENRIDSLIKEAGQFFYKTDKNRTILKKFSKYTYLASRADKIENNNSEYSDAEVKELLKVFNEQYKKPLKRDLIEYYRLKLNPSIKMEGLFLEKLGFRPCGQCHGENFDLQNTDLSEKEKYDRFLAQFLEANKTNTQTSGSITLRNPDRKIHLDAPQNANLKNENWNRNLQGDKSMVYFLSILGIVIGNLIWFVTSSEDHNSIGVIIFGIIWSTVIGGGIGMAFAGMMLKK